MKWTTNITLHKAYEVSGVRQLWPASSLNPTNIHTDCSSMMIFWLWIFNACFTAMLSSSWHGYVKYLLEKNPREQRWKKKERDQWRWEGGRELWGNKGRKEDEKLRGKEEKMEGRHEKNGNNPLINSQNVSLGMLHWWPNFIYISILIFLYFMFYYFILISLSFNAYGETSHYWSTYFNLDHIHGLEFMASAMLW